MQESQVEIKYLKVDKNTDWLSCQSKPPVELLGKARQHGIKSPLRPLGLTTAASTAKITAAIEACNLIQPVGSESKPALAATSANTLVRETL
jgi:hypothetical protein